MINKIKQKIKILITNRISTKYLFPTNNNIINIIRKLKNKS